MILDMFLIHVQFEGKKNAPKGTKPFEYSEKSAVQEPVHLPKKIN